MSGNDAEFAKFDDGTNFGFVQRVHAYAGNRELADRDLHNLIRQGLVRKGMFEGPEANPRELVTLTKRGHHLLRANRVPGESLFRVTTGHVTLLLPKRRLMRA